ncbi:helix-turn-helix domain-containing protein [Halomonas pacifica]|uniref:helix-turn-helix domain-containing protein n=1 Tax=Bisbaumannia pacifica TaxID=77098 RepID=UPI002359449D|nr:helix-turn-helix domain-containing protein [Halomonas pacifica]MDC8802107.1 helix-turn-helix domain-containing protein [Halomonas pacifica]
MPSLPIPMIVAILLAYLAILTLARRDRPWPFVLLILACAVQGTVISLNQHYGVTLFHTVQPVTATLIPPLAWIIFQVTAIRAFAPSRHLPHLLLPAFVAFCMAFAPQVLDIVIPSGFVAYGVALLIALKQGPGNLPLPRLESGERPGLIWRVIALALIASAFSDILILLDQVLGQGRLQAWIIGVFSSLILLVLGALCLSRSLESEPNEACPAAEPPPVMDLEQNRALMERLDHLVTSQMLFLDPGLTLNRLSRKLGVPAKLLSSTINQTTGENVSRYINAYRIEHACLQLEAGESVTSAMLNSGFNTKSNFNREFRRVKGHAPREWLATRAAVPD